MDKEEGEQSAAMAKLMETTRSGPRALIAASQLLGTDIPKHTGLNKLNFPPRITATQIKNRTNSLLSILIH